jgi:hypothetical protein
MHAQRGGANTPEGENVTEARGRRELTSRSDAAPWQKCYYRVVVANSTLKRRLRRALVAIAMVSSSAPLISGCFAFIQPDDIGDNCGIKGESACAACLREKCQTEINNCCKEPEGYSSCSEATFGDDALMPTLDLCGEAQDAASCLYNVTNARVDGPTGVIRKCTLDKCSSECFGDARPHTKCELQEGGTKCTCSDAKKTEGDECSLTSVKASLCYRVPGNSGSSSSRNGYCYCGEVYTSGSTFPSRPTSSNPKGGTCCLGLRYSGSAELQCKCTDYSYECSGERIADCTDESIKAALKNDSNKVERCSN